MEEDIKHLEKRIDLNRQMYLEFGRLLSLDEKTVNAIENLINKNKELEKEVKQCKKYVRRMVGEYQLRFEIIQLMADSLSDVAFYMDEASEYCEVKKKECDCYQNKLGCKECLLDYFRKKAKGE